MENEQEFARRAMIQSEQEKHNSWKSGNEYLPFHPMASHVTPEYRAGWNDAYAAGKARVSNQERVAQPEQPADLIPPNSTELNVKPAFTFIAQPVHVPETDCGNIAQPEQPAALTDADLFDILKSIDPLTARLPPGLKQFARALLAKGGVK